MSIGSLIADRVDDLLAIYEKDAKNNKLMPNDKTILRGKAHRAYNLGWLEASKHLRQVVREIVNG